MPSDIVLQSEIFKALGHPARLVIVKALRNGEKCVCELQPLIGSSLPTISRHLSILKNARVISSEKRGQNIFYRLKLNCLSHIFDCLDNPSETPASDQCHSC
ncbi:MAG: ArsR/SmtB family transcription factor [Oxalobacter sp.]